MVYSNRNLFLHVWVCSWLWFSWHRHGLTAWLHACSVFILKTQIKGQGLPKWCFSHSGVRSSRVKLKHEGIFEDSASIVIPTLPSSKACHMTKPQLQSTGKVLSACSISGGGDSEYSLNNNVNYKKVAFKIIKKPFSEDWDQQKPCLTARLYQALTRESW